MTYMAFTAFIVTVHHLSTMLALIVAAILSVIAYWFFARGRKHRVLIALVGCLVSFVLGVLFAETLFQRAPLSLEIVQAGG